MLVTLCSRLLDSCLAKLGARQAACSIRPVWRRSGLPADPARCARYYGVRPQQAAPRCRPAEARHRASAATWPDTVSAGR